jgi:phasin family protein
MSNTIFDSMNTGAHKLIAPISGLNKTAIDNLAKVAELQFSTAKYLADVGINQLKAAADIDDLESARAFASNSITLAGQVNKKLLDESQKFFSLGAELKSGVANIFTFTPEQATEQSKETVEEQKAKKAAAAK